MCVRARAKGERSRLTLDAMKNVLLLLTRGHPFSLSLNERSIDLVVLLNCFCNKQQPCAKEKCSLAFFQKFRSLCFPHKNYIVNCLPSPPEHTSREIHNNNVSKLTVVVVSKDFSARREQQREPFRFYE